MRITFPESDVYQMFSYPGGELQVRINRQYLNPLSLDRDIQIEARVRSATDVMGLLLLSNAIYMHCLRPQVLHIPYLPYARADRRFVNGDCLGIGVFAQLLSSAHFSEIVALDVHSNRSRDVIEHLRNRDPGEYIESTIETIESERKAQLTILLPDEGARTRYPSFGRPTYAATKVRDAATGKLSGFQVPDIPGDGPILIIDDICDGGGTFIGIAKALKENPDLGVERRARPLFLYVTHGIFSKGVPMLLEYFWMIFTTDSFSSVKYRRLVTYDAFHHKQNAVVGAGSPE